VRRFVSWLVVIFLAVDLLYVIFGPESPVDAAAKKAGWYWWYMGFMGAIGAAAMTWCYSGCNKREQRWAKLLKSLEPIERPARGGKTGREVAALGLSCDERITIRAFSAGSKFQDASMYKLTRLLLILSLVFGLYTVAVFTAIYWPLSGLVLAAIVVVYTIRCLRLFFDSDLGKTQRLLSISTCRASTRSDSCGRHPVSQVTVSRSLNSSSSVRSAPVEHPIPFLAYRGANRTNVTK